MSYVTTKSGLVLSSRAAAELRNSAYDAAKTGGRRLGGWTATAGGPNTVVNGNVNTLRSRSHDSVRNNAWIKRGLSNWVANEVGTGFTAIAKSGDPEFNAAADELWQMWIRECDADGMMNFHGLVALAVRGRQEAGEGFIRARPRRLGDGLTVPLQIQALEAEQCPVSHTSLSQNIRSGIEFNAIGRRTGYWMYREHPGEYRTLAGADLRRVPADMVIHHYAPLRAGQLRGLPWTIQSLIKAKDFDEYDDAELVRKKTRSSFTGYLKKPELPYSEEDWKFDPITGEPITEDDAGVGMTSVEPGTWLAGMPGEEPILFEGDKTGSGYADYVRQQLLGVAAGLDMPYEVLTGDWQEVNDRIARVFLNEYRRILRQSQFLLTIPQVCQRIREWFIDYAVMAGKLPVRDYETRRADYLKTEWRADGWAYIHPEQDVNAKLKKIKAGLSSREAEVAADGLDVREVDRENAEDKKRAEEAGLFYESYPEPENTAEETAARLENMRAEQRAHEARTAEHKARQDWARAQRKTEIANADASRARAKLDAATAELHTAQAAAEQAKADADIRRADEEAQRRAEAESQKAQQEMEAARERQDAARRESEIAEKRAKEKAEAERQIEREKMAVARMEREAAEVDLAELKSL